MSEKLIEELRRENLCTHFILPLLKLNKFSFIASNFVNSYLWLNPDSKRWYIIVQVIDPAYCRGKVFEHPLYMGTLKDSEYTYFQYLLGTDWYYDIETFLEGKFSEMSSKAKDKIRTYSGLEYRSLDSSGTIVSDARLQALEKSRTLKAMWERRIHPDDTIDGMELLSIPDERTFIDIHKLTRINKPGH